MEPKQYYAERQIEIDGKLYNRGDIVITTNPRPGLIGVKAREEREEVMTAPRSQFLKKIDSDRWDGVQPVISVVITAHNHQEFIGMCINSFARQTIEVPYEIIVLNDASSDDTKKMLEENAGSIRHFEVNYRNANSARNDGFLYAKGEYICYFDGDDYAYPQYLEELYKALQENPQANISYARFAHKCYGHKRGRLPRCNVFEWSDRWLEYSAIVNTPSMIRRELLAQVEWDENITIMQDYDFNLALKEAGAVGVHVRKELWHYRSHEGNAWAQPDVVKRKEQAIEYINKKYSRREDKAQFTFVSLISRNEVLDEYFAQIPTLGMPADKTHWLMIVDSDEPEVINRALQGLEEQKHNFLSERVYITNAKNDAYSKDFEERGMRISRFIEMVINQCADPIGGTEFLFMVEDDTIAPPGAFKDLWAVMKKSKKTAYVSGIECGRGFTKHTGVCTLEEDETGEIIKRHIPKTKDSGIDDIDGGGWYCWIGRVELIQNIAYKAIDGKMLGPDVLFVHDLRKRGYDCKVVWKVHCKHFSGLDKKYYNNGEARFLDAAEGRAYDIDFYKEQGQWKYNLHPIA